MWLEWLSQTLSAPTRLPRIERDRRTGAAGILEIGEPLLVEAPPGDGDAEVAPTHSLEVVDPHRS